MKCLVRNAGVRCTTFPYLNFQDAIDRSAEIVQVHFERKRTAQLKHAVEPDFRLDQDLRRRDGRQYAQKQQNRKEAAG